MVPPVPTRPEFPRHAALAAEVAAALRGREAAHDAGHVARVYAWAVRLAPEAGADPDLAGAAALVHDLDATPKDDPARPLGGRRSAALAAPLLERAGYAPAEVEPVLAAVRASSWSAGLAPAGPIGAVLQDADRLDALGAIGVARVFACHGALSQARGVGATPRARGGGALWDATDPFADGGRDLDDARFAVDHFARKLLRLAEGMHLPGARAEAARRHDVLVRFLDDLRRELCGALAPPRRDRGQEQDHDREPGHEQEP